MKKKLVVILAVIMSLAMLLAACGKSTSSGPESSSASSSTSSNTSNEASGNAAVTTNSEPIKLVFWALWDGPDGEYAKAMVEKFAAEKGIKLDFVVFSASQYYTKLKTAGLTNDGPDIAVSHVSAYISDFKKDGIAMSLSKACTDYGVDINFQDYISTVADVAKIDNEYYALPVDNIARLIYYNKSMLKGTSLLTADGKLNLQPGFDNFKAFLDTVKKEVPSAMAPLAFSPQAPQFVLNWLSFYAQKSTTPFFDTANGKVTFDDTAAAKALEDYSVIYNTYCPPNLSGNAHLDLFNTGKIPVLIDGTFNMASCQKAIGDNLGIAYFPQWYDRSAVVSGSHSLMLINKQGRSKEATKTALEFIKWFGENDWQWAKSGALPANIKTYDQKEFTELPGRADLVAASKASLPLPMVPVGMIHQTAEVKDPVEKAMRKEISANDAVKAVKEACQKLFDDNKK